MRPGTTHPDRGDGPPCPEPGDHGHLYYVTGSKGTEMLWCPVTQELFAVADGGHGVGRALRAKVDVAPNPALQPACTPNPALDLAAISLEDF